jgi:hypothetical protein
MQIESPHDLGFKFDIEYYFTSNGKCGLVSVKRSSSLYPDGFIYEFSPMIG